MSDLLFEIKEEPDKKKLEQEKDKKRIPRKSRVTIDFKNLESLTKKQNELLEKQVKLLEQLLLKRSQEKIYSYKDKIDQIIVNEIQDKDENLFADKSIENKILNLLERGRSFNITELKEYLIKFGEDEKTLSIEFLTNIINKLIERGLIISRRNRLYLRSKFRLKITELIKDIVFLLKEKGEIQKKDIENHFSKHPSTIYRNLKILQYEGYIGFKAPNRIFLTEKGQILYSKIN
ncbi:MAG: hypothetical protein EAX96_01435 [Candidatus Lokiarchaeota archaeon]|nr:hypothetical protein [Candidatus Lokiarchaeota archaeon]